MYTTISLADFEADRLRHSKVERLTHNCTNWGGEHPTTGGQATIIVNIQNITVNQTTNVHAIKIGQPLMQFDTVSHPMECDTFKHNHRIYAGILCRLWCYWLRFKNRKSPQRYST